MVRQRGQTSLELRKLIIKHFEEGKSLREISKIVDRSRSTIQYILKRFKQNQMVENKSKTAHNKIFTEADERYLTRKSKADPFLSAPKLAVIAESELGKKVCPQTIRNVLHKADLNGRRARQKPLINQRNQKTRLEFAKTYRNKDFSFWETVLFTDESKFNIFGSDGRPYVWRKRNEELLAKNMKPNVKHGGGSVMVWGSFSAAGPGMLHFIEGIMDQRVYLDILKANLPQAKEKLGLSESWHFYQDNDPKHKAYNVRSWLLYNCPHVIDTPAQSPDINPIENLWSYLDDKVRQHSISSKAQLKQILLEEWRNIEPNFCKKLVDSMPNRLKMVIKNKGLHTKY